MTEQEVLHNPFSIETHAKTFVDYLEVVILEDGTVEYAVPSHMEKLLQLSMLKAGVSDRESFINSYCVDHGISVMEDLLEFTGCISVWTNAYIGKPNFKQRNMLELLKRHGLFKGQIT